MMSDDIPKVLFGVMIGTLLVIPLGFITDTRSVQAIKKQAIERNYAEYHPKTGAWQWKEAGNHAE